MPRPMTQEDLVNAVRELTSRRQPLATSVEVRDWCRRQKPRVSHENQRGRNGNLLEAADNGEASGRHRLQKWKKGPRPCTSPRLNAWCAMENLAEACAWARKNGWLYVPWDATRRRWDWQNSGDCPEGGHGGRGST